MREVWFVFKILETFFGFICMLIHIRGFLYKREPLPHHMFFCGTFVGFTLITMFGNIDFCLGGKVTILMEAVITGFAAIFFFLSSVLSMYHAEQDFHLMYLSDYEESIHPFFAISKSQGISSLICGCIYLLHSIFACDVIMIKEPKSTSGVSRTDDNEEPIQFYIFGKAVHENLEKRGWIKKDYA